MRSSTANNILPKSSSENATKLAFFLFSIWAFIVLCRPQDIFLFLGQFRPALAIAVLTMGLVAIQLKHLPGPLVFRERQVKYYLALVIIMIFGIPWSLYPRNSFTELFTVYINVIVFFFIFYKLVSSEKRLSTIILIACLGNGMYSASAVLTGGFELSRLFFGDMFDPNDLAFFAIGFLPLNLIFLSRDNPSWMRLACLSSFGFGTLLILYTGSRGGLVAFSVVMILLFLRRTTVLSFSLKAVCAAIFVVVVALAPIETERYRTILSFHDDYNIQDESGRIALWEIGVRAMLQNPLTGVGVGSYGMAVGLDRQARGLESARWQTAHNSFVQIGAETGVVGLVLFLWMSINVFFVFNKVRNQAVQGNLKKIGEMGFAGFAGIFVSGLFLSQAYSFYWAFYIVLSALTHQFLMKEPIYGEQNQVSNG